MKTKLTLVAVMLVMLIGSGVALCRWANEQSKATEARFADAVRVMQGK